MAQPDGDEAQRKGEHGICAGFEPFAIADERERLQAERGKRRVAAADADHHELPGRGRNEPASLRPGQRGEPADDERAGDIHQQRAPGKSLAELAGDETRSSKPGDAAQPAAEKDPKIAHNNSTAHECSVGVISSESCSGGSLATRDGKPHCLTNFILKPQRSKTISGEVHLKNPRGQRLAEGRVAGRQIRAASIWQFFA